MVRPSYARFTAEKNCMKRELGTVNDKQAKCEKRLLKYITTQKRQNQTEVNRLKKKTSNNCSVKSGQLRVTSLVLEEQLKAANKKLHSEATYKLGLDIQTKNGTTWRCSEKNMLFMFSLSSHY